MRDVEQIQRMAERLLALSGRTRPPVVLKAVARSMGVRLYRDLYDLEGNRVFDFPVTEEGIGVRSGKTALIRYRVRGVPSTRQRFTVAHELGHIVLHVEDDDADDVWLSSGVLALDPQKEAEADRFASELLMPEVWVHEHVVRGLRFPWLCAKFHVSKSAMSRRLEELGLRTLQSPALTALRPSDDAGDPFAAYPSVTGDADEDRILWERRSGQFLSASTR